LTRSRLDGRPGEPGQPPYQFTIPQRFLSSPAPRANEVNREPEQEIAPRRAQEAAGKAEEKGAAVEMDEIMNKVGAYWLGQRANKEISSAGDDIEVRGTKLSHPCSFLLLVMFRQSFVWS